MSNINTLDAESLTVGTKIDCTSGSGTSSTVGNAYRKIVPVDERDIIEIWRAILSQGELSKRSWGNTSAGGRVTNKTPITPSVEARGRT